MKVVSLVFKLLGTVCFISFILGAFLVGTEKNTEQQGVVLLTLLALGLVLPAIGFWITDYLKKIGTCNECHKPSLIGTLESLGCADCSSFSQKETPPPKTRTP